VFPAFIAGLNCGYQASFISSIKGWRVPGVHRRAQLRREGAGANRASGDVFPAFIAGLNCGTTSTRAYPPPEGVFPAFIAGLNCSNHSGISVSRPGGVFPAFIAGLNCGLCVKPSNAERFLLNLPRPVRWLSG